MKCSYCGLDISRKEVKYSMKKYGKRLCMDCQQDFEYQAKQLKEGKLKSTSEATKLYDTLIKMGVNAKLEQYDGYKHIDVAIPEAKINIEVDGIQHNYSEKQAIADLKRTYYSFKKGYVTLRIPNKLIQKKCYETVGYIKKMIDIGVRSNKGRRGFF